MRGRRGRLPAILGLLAAAVITAGCTQQVHDVYVCNHTDAEFYVLVDFHRNAMKDPEARPHAQAEVNASAKSLTGPASVSLRSGSYEVVVHATGSGGDTAIQRGFRVTYGDPVRPDSEAVILVTVDGPESISVGTTETVAECA